MPGVSPNNRSASKPTEIYVANWEHLADELKRLDLLLYLQVCRQRNRQPENPLEPFKGLVLTESEIVGLLTGSDTLLAGDIRLSPEDSDSAALIAALSEVETRIQERRDASFKEGIYLALPHLAQLFQLTPFEEQCLLICLAPELDRKYEKLYAYLQDDVTRKKPGVDLMLNLLCPTMQEKLAARMVFDPRATLLRYRLLQVEDTDGPTPLLSRFLKLDDRIVNFLLGFGQIDARLEQVARLISPQAEPDRIVDEEIRNRARSFVRAHFSQARPDRKNAVFYLHGPYGSGHMALAEIVCHELGVPLVVADAEKMLGGALPFEEVAWLLGREAVLQPTAICVENFDCLLVDNDQQRSRLMSLFEAARAFSPLTFLLGTRSWKPQGLTNGVIFIDIEFPIPDDRARKQLWESFLSRHGWLGSHIDPGVLASSFRLTPGQIREALESARSLASWRAPEDGQLTMADLYSACRALSNPKLGDLACKIDARCAWADIVLPQDQLAQLREICSQAKYRHIVYGEWGFDRKLSLGKGLNVLFSGPPGTGKTMAAEVIANELHLDLYKIDLSQVVSKYIGDTEKNLHQIFYEAQMSNAILFFDEADALFGKRSEVKDAHDRYANIEIAYLLQKMDEYEGIVILATNLRHHMDEAFVRRMHVIIEFPFPDEEYRKRIWEVVFPREAPLGEDVDFSVLAREIRLAGGNIKNIALSAAFFAAEGGEVIRMPHLIRAAQREHQKLGRTWSEAQMSI